MAIEWAMLCDLAYFDAYRNLCLIGAQTQSPVPVLADPHAPPGGRDVAPWDARGIDHAGLV